MEPSPGQCDSSALAVFEPHRGPHWHAGSHNNAGRARGQQPPARRGGAHLQEAAADLREEGPEASSTRHDEEGRTSRRQLLICERKGPRSAALSGTGYCCRNSSTVLRTSSADRETPRCLLAASTGRTRSMKPAARGGVLRGAVVP